MNAKAVGPYEFPVELLKLGLNHDHEAGVALTH